MNQNFLDEYQPYLFLIFGLFALGFAVFRNSKKSKLKQTGISVEGIIFEQSIDSRIKSSHEDSYPPVNDKIIIRFVTQNKEWITQAIKQDFQFFYTGQYKNGDTVKVYYDKDNPSSFYVDTKQSEWIGRLVIGVTGLLFAVFGLYKLIV